MTIWIYNICVLIIGGLISSAFYLIGKSIQRNEPGFFVWNILAILTMASVLIYIFTGEGRRKK